MKSLAKFVGAALVGAFMMGAVPAARAQTGVIITSGAPAWGPQVPYGTQYYYIPEIDGYYDLYNQQYIVYQDGYWVPLPALYGYDPYQFHPVVVDYRGAQPWLRVDYYRQRYAYQPYCNYGPSHAGYYSGGYGRRHGRPRYYNRSGYANGRYYGYRDRDDRGGYRDRGSYRGNNNRGGNRDTHGQYPGGNNTLPGNPIPQQPAQQPQLGPRGGGYSSGQGNHGGTGNGQGQPAGNQGSNGGGNNGGGRGHGRD